VVEDAGRGWRRVVASPLPKEVVELDTVKALLNAGLLGAFLTILLRHPWKLAFTLLVIAGLAVTFGAMALPDYYFEFKRQTRRSDGKCLENSPTYP
jgi:hypothetical protein